MNAMGTVVLGNSQIGLPNVCNRNVSEDSIHICLDVQPDYFASGVAIQAWHIP